MLSIWSGLRWAKPVAAALLVAGTAAACATGPVYKPRGPGDVVGYSDQRLTDNRFRVTFSGGTGTRREEVEDYLMRRAAEVTLQNGYTHFVFDARDTEARTYYRNFFGPRAGFGFGYGYPYWRYRPWYWSSFAFGDPFYGDVYPVTRYQAYSEIVALNAQQAQNEPDAIDARQVLAALTPPAPPPQT